jgi:hypothetical protein
MRSILLLLSAFAALATTPPAGGLDFMPQEKTGNTRPSSLEQSKGSKVGIVPEKDIEHTKPIPIVDAGLDDFGPGCGPPRSQFVDHWHPCPPDLSESAASSSPEPSLGGHGLRPPHQKVDTGSVSLEKRGDMRPSYMLSEEYMSGEWRDLVEEDDETREPSPTVTKAKRDDMRAPHTSLDYGSDEWKKMVAGDAERTEVSPAVNNVMRVDMGPPSPPVTNEKRQFIPPLSLFPNLPKSRKEFYESCRGAWVNAEEDAPYYCAWTYSKVKDIGEMWKGALWQAAAELRLKKEQQKPGHGDQEVERGYGWPKFRVGILSEDMSSENTEAAGVSAPAERDADVIEKSGRKHFQA